MVLLSLTSFQSVWAMVASLQWGLSPVRSNSLLTAAQALQKIVTERSSKLSFSLCSELLRESKISTFVEFCPLQYSVF